MKILACHGYYQQLGGENLLFDEETQMLEEHGETVIRFTCHNDEVRSYGSLTLARKTIWNHAAAADLRDEIRRTKPDVMHCTNTFPLLSPSVYSAAHAEGVPVVQSLHNFRLICPKAQFFRDSQVCEDCLGKVFAWPAILHGCYRDNRAASAVVAGMLAWHNVRNTWSRDVDRYITTTDFSRQKLIEGGLNGDKIVVKQNFVRRDPGFVDRKEGYVVFVGRLSPEKGIETLLSVWSRVRVNNTLKVVGGGPLESEVRAAAMQNSRIEWLGELTWEETMDVVGRATCLVMPSIWYETFGRVIPEAFATGTPVIVSRLGAMAELVDDGRTGLLFNPHDPVEMQSKIEQLLQDETVQGHLRVAARREYEEKYTADVNYALQMQIYERVIAAARE